jgi:tRNA (guanine37-N1)-methyltransferase
MRFDVLTLFPGIFAGFLGESLLDKAIQRELVRVHLHDFRKWAGNKHQSVDDRPYGGGQGMVLSAAPIVDCVEEIRGDSPVGRLILLTPQGRVWDQVAAEEMARQQDGRVVFICGRYEGFDQRVIDVLQPEEWSLGDYVLNGGEVAAMAIIESVIRLIPGVLGDSESSVDDSFSEGNRLLEGPQYTRPREYRGYRVPDVLLSGDHQAIARWRREKSLQRTQERRQDLLPKTDPPRSSGEEIGE